MKKLQPSKNFVGISMIKKSSTKNGKPTIINEIWTDQGDNPNKQPSANNWKLLQKTEQPDYIRPRWVDNLEEYLAIPEEERKNVHIKSKPTHSDPFINEKGEICIRCSDEYDHQYTIRLDNPYKLNANQAKKILDDLSK